MARFYTSDGQFVGMRNLPYGALSFGQALVRKAFGYTPKQPWIPFTARRYLQTILTTDSIVWEIGAGFSTLWMADRVKKITSIEASKEWYEKLSNSIDLEHIDSVDLRYEWEAERMADFSDVEDDSLDLLFIDGGPRGLCLEKGFQKVKPGGHIYLDNWDSKHFWGNQTDFPDRRKSQIRWSQSFVNYVPAQFGVYEGLLLRKS